MDIVQTYEESASIVLYDSATERYTTDYDEFNDTVDRLLADALRDMDEEGFGREDVTVTLELDCIYASQIHPFRFTSPVTEIEGREDVERICDAFNEAYAESYSRGATFPEGGIVLENVKLNAVAPMDDPTLPTYELSDSDPSAARKGTRGVMWDVDDGYVDSPIYDRDDLVAGNVVEGPAIIEDVGTTHVITPGRVYRVDEYGHGVITEASQ
jgi:N-methylhydantoinase A/oxoprolinase/acetone carboxylase beta subunit